MEVHLMALMDALFHQKTSLVLNLVKQEQNFAWVCVTIMTIVICLVMEKESLKPIIIILTFGINFV